MALLLAVAIFCAIQAPEIGIPISQQAISNAVAKEHVLVFSGGTGNPFFTTDTNAVLRALQMQADEMWKATVVGGLYDSDPRTNSRAKLIDKTSHQFVLDNELGIMDATAVTLAKEHKLKIRIFNVLEDEALIAASKDETFGSIIE